MNSKQALALKAGAVVWVYDPDAMCVVKARVHDPNVWDSEVLPTIEYRALPNGNTLLLADSPDVYLTKAAALVACQKGLKVYAADLKRSLDDEVKHTAARHKQAYRTIDMMLNRVSKIDREITKAKNK